MLWVVPTQPLFIFLLCITALIGQDMIPDREQLVEASIPQVRSIPSPAWTRLPTCVKLVLARRVLGRWNLWPALHPLLTLSLLNPNLVAPPSPASVLPKASTRVLTAHRPTSLLPMQPRVRPTLLRHLVKVVGGHLPLRLPTNATVLRTVLPRVAKLLVVLQWHLQLKLLAIAVNVETLVLANLPPHRWTLHMSARPRQSLFEKGVCFTYIQGTDEAKPVAPVGTSDEVFPRILLRQSCLAELPRAQSMRTYPFPVDLFLTLTFPLPEQLFAAPVKCRVPSWQVEHPFLAEV